MKKTAISIILIFLFTGLFAQSTNDRRGFQGVVTSAVKDDAPASAKIEFTGRTIVIDGDAYEIIKKSFDGKNQTVFTCTKRRGTFDITYTVGESIKIVDTTNTEAVIIYKSLKEG